MDSFILLFIFLFIFSILCVSIYFNVKFGLIILNMQDILEESLDDLDKKYAVFSKILERPVFFDSVEVRQVIQEIKGCQDLLLKIANNISNPGGKIEDKKDSQ
jgi:hypothetical protein